MPSAYYDAKSRRSQSADPGGSTTLHDSRAGPPQFSACEVGRITHGLLIPVAQRAPQAPSHLHPARPPCPGVKGNSWGLSASRLRLPPNRLRTGPETGGIWAAFRTRRLPPPLPGTAGNPSAWRNQSAGLGGGMREWGWGVASLPACPPAAHKYSLGPEKTETDFPACLLALAHLFPTPTPTPARRTLHAAAWTSHPSLPHCPRGEGRTRMGRGRLLLRVRWMRAAKQPDPPRESAGCLPSRPRGKGRLLGDI